MDKDHTDVDAPTEDIQLTDNDMLVDEYDQYKDEKTDVVLVSPPDSLDGQEVEPLADDYDAMMAKLLPEDSEYETEDRAYHTWHIQDWRRLRRKEHGPVFECGGAPWRILFFPTGNNVEYASFYLEHGFEDGPPDDWYACVQFGLVLWNRNDPSIYISHVANHRFYVDEGDWGFTRFCELRRLFNQAWEGHDVPLVENDEANITAYVRVVKDPTGVLWHNFQNYDSKKETGMVGLKNQGATCYLNSLLQSLYFTNAFRKAVYQIPTEEDANRDNSAWTLQRLFYNLQTNDNAISTQELTHSFGWESRQIFEQQDVQELERILMEKLEIRMKGTSAEKTLPDLFLGKTKTYVSCIHVDYESSTIGDFWDIQLNVQGNRTLDDSFRDYIQVETLDGENKYDAGPPHGLQEAKKGDLFVSFPPVLHLHLKRFQYDFNRDAMMKINDRHEFPEEFDAAPYLTSDADMSEPWIYQLHGVLVHSGELNAGHYYAYLRPYKDGCFYRFDDDRVVRATMKETMEENFGGEYANLANGAAGVRQPFSRTLSTKRSMNAYMLVYIRKSRVDDVLVEVKEDDVPSHIKSRLAEERVEQARRKKEREEQHLYLNVGLLSNDSFKSHHSFDLTSPDLEPSDPAAPKIYRVLRSTKLGEFASQIAEEKDLKPEQVRFWAMVNRQNKTSRPDQPIRDVDRTIEEAWNRHAAKGSPFRLWVDVGDISPDGTVAWPESQGPNGSVLVFLKYFDVLGESLTGVGNVYVRKNAKVADLAGPILEIMNWAPGTQFSLFEEIKHSMIEPMKAKQTFQQSEIQDGDIICFQRTFNDSEIPPTVIYRDARQYYDYLLNRITVKFAPLDKDTDGEEFNLTLSRKMTYEQFSTKVGEHLGVEPTHIRFAPVVASTGRPKPFIKRTITQNLQQILAGQYATYGYNMQRSDALFYEVLETSLSEYETKKNLKVTWLPEGITKEVPYEVLVAKHGTISDLVAGLQKRANLDDETAQDIRIYEAHGGKIYKEVNDNYSVAGINEYVTLYAERMPEEEADMAEGERTIYAFNFDKEPNKPHGVPFKFVVKPGEPFKETRERLSKRTGLRGKQLEKIKFAVVTRTLYSSPRYLEDDDILADIVGDSDDTLGLDHVNKNRGFWNGGGSFFIR